MQPWDLLRVVEPDSRLRNTKEQCASVALMRGIDEIKLSNVFAPILTIAKQIKYAEEHFLIDANSHENGNVRDTLVFCTPTSRKKKLRSFLQQLRDSLPE